MFKTAAGKMLTILLLTISFTSSGQVKMIRLIDGHSEQAISNASIIFENGNGTVSDDQGIAKIVNANGDSILISHINYQPKTIYFRSLEEQVARNIKLEPLPEKTLEAVVVTGINLTGRWQVIEITGVIIDHNGKEKRQRGNMAGSPNIKEYLEDKTFKITNRGKLVLSGYYEVSAHQIKEQVTISRIQHLHGITNILSYYLPASNKNQQEKRILVKYQLPGSPYVTEEIWEKL